MRQPLTCRFAPAKIIAKAAAEAWSQFWSHLLPSNVATGVHDDAVAVTLCSADESVPRRRRGE